MKTPMIASLTLCLLFSVSTMIAITDAATVFGGSRIVGIDQAQRTITFKTKDRQTWTLTVVDPNVLKQQPIANGDQVTIEIDLDDRITKVLKLSEVSSPAPRAESDEQR